MKVKEIIKELEQYNPDAEMIAVANNRIHKFSIVFGGGDDSTKENCPSVSIMLGELNKGDYIFFGSGCIRLMRTRCEMA